MTNKLLVLISYITVVLAISCVFAFTACGHEFGAPHKHCGSNDTILVLR